MLEIDLLLFSGPGNGDLQPSEIPFVDRDRVDPHLVPLADDLLKGALLAHGAIFLVVEDLT